MQNKDIKFIPISQVDKITFKDGTEVEFGCIVPKSLNLIFILTDTYIKLVNEVQDAVDISWKTLVEFTRRVK